MSDANRANSGGGAATAAGTTFQEDVACYFSTLILAESCAEPPTGLPQDVRLSGIVAETLQPIDDLLVETSVDGLLYVQAKTAPSLSDALDSDFAKVIDQFVRQRLHGARPMGGPTRPLDAARDRFILAVGHGAPATITNSLASVLLKCRPITDEGAFSELPGSLNREEDRALAATRANIQRSWTTIKGAAPTGKEELSILHLMYVLQLDMRVDGAARNRSLDLLRLVILRDVDRAGDAWSALILICRAFGPKRAGGDLAYLRAELQNRGIPIHSVPSFNEDIESLRRYTRDRLHYLEHRSFMELEGKRIRITREVAAALLEFAQTDHTAVVGEPGAGKSGCVHDLAAELLNTRADVVLLAADMVMASSPEVLAADLGLSKDRRLVDVLQNWSGEGIGFLIVDALDAARSGMSLHVLCQILRDVRKRAPRWHIVASIREYDLRTSPDVQDLFDGSPHANFNDPRFPLVRHVQIGRLSEAELTQVSGDHPSIASAVTASSALGKLVQNPFNLSLLCKLLDNNVSDAELSAVQTQVGLLDLYWNRRVEAGDRLGRLQVLGAAVEQMVAGRALHVPRQSLASAVAASAASLDALLSDGVLVELAPKPRAAPIVGFAHNILFDYAVCRLWLNGLTDAVVAKLSEQENHDLLLAIRPSIAMAFEELWYDDESRAGFWARAIAFEQAPGMRLVGKIVAAGVAAQQFRHVPEVQSLIEALRQQNSSGAALLRFTIQAALTQQDSEPGQRSLIGEGAADWMALAFELRGNLDQVAWEVRSLLRPMIQRSSVATPEQALSANRAAVALLRYGLGHPRYHNVVRPALEVAAATIATDPDPTVIALAEVLRDENLAIGAHEWLHPLTERLHLIAQVKPEFALQIVDVVFKTSGDRDAAVPMGSRILALSMNKHDLVRMARHDVQQVLAKIWEQDPVTATRLAVRVMNATVEEEHAGLSEPVDVCRFPFRGGEATLRPDNSYVWAAGEHNRHEEWYQILSIFRQGLKNLALQDMTGGRLGQVLDVLRDGAQFAIIWKAVLEAATEQPERLGRAVSDLVAAPKVLAQIDTCKAAGDLIETGFKYFSIEKQSAIESAIIRIPKAISKDLQEYAEHRRNRMLGCIPAHLIQSSELQKIRADLDSAGGPPSNEPDFSITTSWGSGDDDWWLRQKGVKPDRRENAPLFKLGKALRVIRDRTPSEQFTIEAATQYLPLLQEAETAVTLGRDAGADPPLVEEVDDELIAACEHLTSTNGLRKDMPLVEFLRTTLRRGATSDRPQHQVENDAQWDKDFAGWGSPSPRIDAARGLLRLAASSEAVDGEVLADVARLAQDRVPAVRFQVLTHCGWLHRTAPDLMWSLIEMTCASEPRTGVLTFFASNVLLPPRRLDYERLEPHVRKLYRRCRRSERIRKVRKHCATFYLDAALLRRDQRAIRYLRAFAKSPLVFSVESNTIIDHCRGLIRYVEAKSAEENRHVRGWAFSFLTRLVKTVLSEASTLRQKHADATFAQ